MEYHLVKFPRFSETVEMIYPNGKIQESKTKFWDGINPIHKIFLDCVILSSRNKKDYIYRILKNLNKSNMDYIRYLSKNLGKRIKENKKNKIQLIDGVYEFIDGKNYSCVELLDTVFSELI